MSFFDGGFGAIGGSITSAIGGLIGGHYDRSFARAQSEADRNFQREVYQNQYQWKAADAKKAGLHPLAVIGGGSYSASPSSQPSSSSMASSLGKLGEGIGDAFTAYLNKDEIQALKNHESQSRDLDIEQKKANLELTRAQTAESVNRGKSYSRPMATGREYIKGQVDSGDSAIPQRATNPSVIIRPVPGVTGSSFDFSRYSVPHDINMSTEYQQELGDEFGQVYNALRKRTREWKRFWRDPATGIEYRFDPKTGYWYEAYSGGGGGV